MCDLKHISFYRYHRTHRFFFGILPQGMGKMANAKRKRLSTIICGKKKDSFKHGLIPT